MREGFPRQSLMELPARAQLVVTGPLLHAATSSLLEVRGAPTAVPVVPQGMWALWWESLAMLCSISTSTQHSASHWAPWTPQSERQWGAVGRQGCGDGV